MTGSATTAAGRVSLLAAVLFGTANVAASEAPGLVLQITVDQLRADLPLRYYDRLGEGGFRRLYEQGIVYRDAHHPHANTETIVGHTTLATGAYPAAHGMVGNLWFDRESGFTTDIAVTLSAYLGLKLPSGASGRVLEEVVER